jgi:hypothetical protein
MTGVANGNAISAAFRVFRLFRFFKLQADDAHEEEMRRESGNGEFANERGVFFKGSITTHMTDIAMPAMRRLLTVIQKMAWPLSSLIALLLLFMYVTSLIGMALFANRLHFDPLTGLPLTFRDPGFATAHVPRSNFDDMLGAFTVIFQVLTGEEWDKVR